MQEEPQDISRLLRLKRFEQPPPEYYNRFLEEFQNRQRAQLLREPAWRIAWDRMRAFFGEQMPVRLGYGLASTAVLVAAAIASFNILESRPLDTLDTASGRGRQHADQTASLHLNPQVKLPDLPSWDIGPAHTISTPRYVMDTRPVSYELSSPSSF